MNTMIVFKQPDGGAFSEIDTHNGSLMNMLRLGLELVTPPLDGMILPGVTRDSVLALARDHAEGKVTVEGLPEPGKFVVNERPVTMKEVKAAGEEGRLVEFFGTGTVQLRSSVKRYEC